MKLILKSKNVSDFAKKYLNVSTFLYYWKGVMWNKGAECFRSVKNYLAVLPLSYLLQGECVDNVMFLYKLKIVNKNLSFNLIPLDGVVRINI